MERTKIKFNNEGDLYPIEIGKYRELLKKELVDEKKISNLAIYKMKFIDEAMSFDEFNLYWKKIIIKGGIREWRKKCSDLIWKNEMLNSRKIEDLFYYNYKVGTRL